MAYTPFPEQDDDIQFDDALFGDDELIPEQTELSSQDFPSDPDISDAEVPLTAEAPRDMLPSIEIELPEMDPVPVSPAPDIQEQPFDLGILDDPELDHIEDSLTAADLPATIPAPIIPEYPAVPAEPVPAEIPVEQPPQMPAPEPKPVRKGRPRRKKGEGMLGIPNILVTVVWLALVVAIGVTLGRILWVCASDVLAFGRSEKAVTITVYETDTIDDITEKLHKAELIRYPGLFKLYAKFAVDEGEIHPGIWDLNTLYDYHALVKMMTPSSSREVVKVLIPEGYTCRQIFELMEQNKVCTAKDLAAYAADGELDDYWFLEGITRGDKYCLEGFLFPDTYEFYTNDSPKNVLTRMLNNFDNRFTEDMFTQIFALNDQLTAMMRADGKSEDFIAKHQFGVRDVIIVASMVEKETASADEGYTIASVIYNRLFRWGSTPAFLNIDASIIYALDGKTNLTVEDMRVDSPYNTYTNVGLTPGPIANPGLSSIRAALEPASTDYYFYVLDNSTGVHHFSRTLEEHEAFRESQRQ